MITRSRIILAGLALVGPLACAEASRRPGFDAPALVETTSHEPPPPPDFGGSVDASALDSGDASFQTCAATAVEAQPERLPVDIIWVVDNSSSMQPAVTEVQAGLNAFATLIESKGIDYKVIMLSKRGSSPLTGSGANRYPICIPPPLAGPDCGNSSRFFHASLDVKSTQPLEQLLGTLDQTAGYTASDERGSEPWSQELRSNATKTIVIVSDDDSRFSATSFEQFPGGKNPYNSTTLPAGILHPSRNGQFAGYVLNALYGWESPTVPSLRCTYPNGGQPAAPGEVYTDLVTKTGGVRAKICDGAGAWGPFFDGVAQAVVTMSRVACELAIPAPDAGVLDPEAVNVQVSDGTSPAVVVPRVPGASACGAAAGWYYDDPKSPTKVLLCPASCDAAQSKGGAAPPKIDVLFGCQSVVR